MQNFKLDIFSIACAVVASLVIAILVKTWFLALFFALDAFFIVFLLLTYLRIKGDQIVHISLSFSNSTFILYAIGLFATLVVFLAPAPRYSTLPFGAILTSIELYPLLRILSGCFLVSIFPGAIICQFFFRDENLRMVEKIGIIMSLSYLTSIVLGLVLRFTGFGLDLISLVLALWLFVAATSFISYLKKERPPAVFQKNFGILDVCLLIVASVCVLFSSYYITLCNRPTSFALAYDISRYTEVANAFILAHPYQEYRVYEWFQFYLAETSILTGLQPIYAYICLQYLLLLLPAAMYSLVRTLFQGNKKAPILGFLFVSILGSLSAIVIHYFYSYYATDSVWNALNWVNDKIGLDTFYIFVDHFDKAFSLFAAAFSLRYINSHGKRIYLLLASVFFNLAFFSHFIIYSLGVIIALFIYSVVYGKLKLIGKLLLSTTFFFIFFEILTGFIFCNFFMNYYVIFNVMFYGGAKMYTRLWALVLAIPFVLVLFVGPKYFSKRLKGLSRIKKSILKPNIQFVFPLLAIVIFQVAFATWQLNFYDLSLGHGDMLSLLYPWYVFLIRNYGVYFLITIAAIPVIVAYHGKKPLAFLTAWVASLALLGFLSVLVPSILSPLIWGNRSFREIRMPLICLSALSLSLISLGSTSRRTRAKAEFWPKKQQMKKTLISVSLTAMITVSILSYAYGTERMYGGSYETGMISSGEAGAYQWIEENVSKNSVFLTYSYYMSYLRLVSLTSKQIVSCELMEPAREPVISWPLDVVLRSQDPSLVLYSLQKTGIDYIFLTNDDLDSLSNRFAGSALLSLLNGFPVVYKEDGVSIHEVPSRPLFSDASYVLVEPTLDLSSNISEVAMKNFQTAFNLLLALNTSFTVVPDIDLDKLEPYSVYFFPFNRRVTTSLYEKLSDWIANGTNIVLMDPEFASLDEFSTLRKHYMLDILALDRRDYTNASWVVFSDYDSIQIKNCSLHKLTPRNRNIEIFANYTDKFEPMSPYIARNVLGKGSATLIHLTPLQIRDALLNEDQQKLLVETARVLSNMLPKSLSATNPLTLPYPSDLYQFLFPIALNVYKLRGLDGYITATESLTMEGRIAIYAKQVFWKDDNIPFSKLTIENNTYRRTFDDGMLASLTVKGLTQAKLESSKVTIYNMPTISLAKLSVTAPLTSQFSLDTGAEATLYIEKSGKSEKLYLTSCNITMVTSQTKSTSLSLKQPKIELNGDLNTAWEGAFWHKGLLYSTVIGPQAFPISGNLSLQIQRCTGTILVEMISISDVKVDRR